MSNIPAMQFDLSRISEEIQLQGINKSILAERAKLSVGWVSRVLRGEDNASPKAIKAMADAVGLSLRDLAKNRKRRSA